MPTWQPAYFPQVILPVRNRGTDECILTAITFECLSISEEDPTYKASEEPTEARRDLCYSIMIDLDNPKASQLFPLSVRIPAGETLRVLVVVGAKRSVRTRFVLHFQYDLRGRASSSEIALNITNNRKFERCYIPGIALELLEFLNADGHRDLETRPGIEWEDMLRSLYRQNRPLNMDFLRSYGPGSAYFFSANEGPWLPTAGDAPVRLEHSNVPIFYVAVGPAYAVRHLTNAEAMELARDPRLAPPVAGASAPPFLYGLNEYGACSVADVSSGFAVTQILPGCGLTAINTEIFTESSAARFIGAIQRDGLSLIPWGQIHQLAIDTVNRFIEALKDVCDLHGPVFVRVGLVNVEGRTLAHVNEDPRVFKGQIIARGPLRDQQYLFFDFLDHPDAYKSGVHVVAPWSEMIAADAMAGRMPKILSPE